MLFKKPVRKKIRKFVKETFQLTRSQVDILLELIFRWNEFSGQCNPRLVTIAKDVGCNKRTVLRAVEKFNKEKIFIKRKIFWGRNEYQPGNAILKTLGLIGKMSPLRRQNVTSRVTKCHLTTEQYRSEQCKEEQTSVVEIDISPWIPEKVGKLASALGNQISETDRNFLEKYFVTEKVSEFEADCILEAVEKRRRAVKSPVGYVRGILANIRRKVEKSESVPEEEEISEEQRVPIERINELGIFKSIETKRSEPYQEIQKLALDERRKALEKREAAKRHPKKSLEQQKAEIHEALVLEEIEKIPVAKRNGQALVPATVD